MAKSRLHELTERGQSVWFDTLSRELVHSGGLAAHDGRGRRHRRHVESDDLPEGALRGRRLRRAAEGAARDGRRPERDLLRARARGHPGRLRCAAAGVRRERRQDGYVSMEVEPGIAYDTKASFDQARWIAKEVDRANLYVKIPATAPGLPAIEDCIAHGTSINITLIFSLKRYKAVVEAYLRGLERLVAGGGDPSQVVSVASFFVSRVDTETDKRLEALGHKASRASSPSPTRSSPTSTTSRRSRRRAGTSSRRRGRGRSGASGRRRRRRTRRTTT